MASQLRPRSETNGGRISKARVTGFRYDPQEIEQDLKRAFDQVGWKTYMKRDSRVFVKPNLTLPFYKPGVTTTPRLLEAALGILKDRVTEVFVGESDGGNGSFKADYALRNHGIPDMCRRTGATMLNLSTVPRKRITQTVNGIPVEVTLPSQLLEIDESISVPVLKVHVVTGVSLSLKNMWGCHPDAMRLRDHSHLPERVALIAACLRLRFVVVDAIYGLNRRGPIDGQPVSIGAILVGDNPVATDAVATRLMGFKAENIAHIVTAHRAGLGPLRTSEIQTMANLASFQQEFTLRPTLVDFLGGITFKSDLLTRLVFDSKVTRLIYAVTGSKYARRIMKPGDEF